MSAVEPRSLPAGVRVVGYGTVVETESPTAETESGRGRSSWWFFWTWLVTPHIEFGAIYVGMIVVLYLDMSLVQAVIGILLGTAFGAISHGVLTARGVQLKVPQIVLGRSAFGDLGSLIVTTMMAIISSFGWFIVNSVVAGLAINSLFGLPVVAGTAVAVVVQLFLAQIDIPFAAVQRYLFPLITLVLVVSGIIGFVKADPSVDAGQPWNLNGLIAIVVVACIAWAYTIGWNPYATDYSKWTPVSASPRMAGVCSGLGLFIATAFLMIIGTAAAIVVEAQGNAGEFNPTTQFTSFLPDWLGVVVLLCLIGGSWTNNAMTLRSARTLFNVEGLGFGPRMGSLLGPIVMTVLAFLLGWAATSDLPASYEGYIMVLGVWIGPWVNIALIDTVMRRSDDPTALLYDEPSSNRWGLFALLFGISGSILIFALQVFDGGRLPHGGVSYAALGMLAGFYLSAVVYSIGLKRLLKEKAASRSG
ncbi:hypothetical protein GYA93_08365 [Gordonia desulfuricans]|uniref:Cytosine permease n=1 Tax=Gordonia desulfuricans TaxID=89051 RepID=A0A7K3LMX6_9ACTN|nr:cytosine permease [Gordonia desulfuricans]NDK89589.1 hypothetical protein [Gordonia desulfuricans]